jgi:NADH dehydrogenase
MIYVRNETDRHPPLLPLPFVFALPIGLMVGWLSKLIPGLQPPLTGDQVTMLLRDNIVGLDANTHTIQELGVTALESVEAIAPTYLWRFRPYGQFQTTQSPV